MSNQYTRGPWEVSGDSDGNGVITRRGDLHYWITGVISNAADGDAQANARLIAAAPEMLDALTRIAGLSMSQFANALDMASEAALIAATAVNKATGES